MTRKSRISKSSGLRTIHSLKESPMKKGILHVKLMNWPITRVSNSEHYTDCCRFNHWAESLIIIDARSLSKPAKYPASFVSVKRPISMKFVLEYPFTSDHVGCGGARDQIPSMIIHESNILLFHRSSPVRISEGITKRARNWRERLSVETKAYLTKSRFPAGRHLMIIDNRGDGNSTSRRNLLDIARWGRNHAGAAWWL
jgi:hypothetical protein